MGSDPEPSNSQTTAPSCAPPREAYAPHPDQKCFSESRAQEPFSGGADDQTWPALPTWSLQFFSAGFLHVLRGTIVLVVNLHAPGSIPVALFRKRPEGLVLRSMSRFRTDQQDALQVPSY